MPVLRYGAAFWLRFCEVLRSELGPGWAVSYTDEVLQESGDRLLVITVSSPFGQTERLAATIKPGFDRLTGPQRQEAIRQAGRHYAEQVKVLFGEG